MELATVMSFSQKESYLDQHQPALLSAALISFHGGANCAATKQKNTTNYTIHLY